MVTTSTPTWLLLTCSCLLDLTKSRRKAGSEGLNLWTLCWWLLQTSKLPFLLAWLLLSLLKFIKARLLRNLASIKSVHVIFLLDAWLGIFRTYVLSVSWMLGLETFVPKHWSKVLRGSSTKNAQHAPFLVTAKAFASWTVRPFLKSVSTLADMDLLSLTPSSFPFPTLRWWKMSKCKLKSLSRRLLKTLQGNKSKRKCLSRNRSMRQS